jgi:hypothetical protein
MHRSADAEESDRMALEEYPPFTEEELSEIETRAKGPKDWPGDDVLHLVAEIRRLRKTLGEEALRREAEEAKPIWEEIVELMQDVPQEEWANLPRDSSENLDHYLYGAPKRHE